MEIFTRLFDNGVMCFWEEVKNAEEYAVKLLIVSNNKKYLLLQDKTSSGKKSYSFCNLGSGEYEIEVNAFSKENEIIESGTKKTNLVSNAQNFNDMACSLQTIFDKLESINSSIESGGANNLIEKVVNDFYDNKYDFIEEIVKILERINRIRNGRY